jgi:hypothetical protein
MGRILNAEGLMESLFDLVAERRVSEDTEAALIDLIKKAYAEVAMVISKATGEGLVEPVIHYEPYGGGFMASFISEHEEA